MACGCSDDFVMHNSDSLHGGYIQPDEQLTNNSRTTSCTTHAQLGFPVRELEFCVAVYIYLKEINFL